MVKKFGLICIILALLTSCATPVRDTNILKPSSKIVQNDGFVIAEVVSNSLNITGPIKQWEELVIWRISPDGKNKDKTLTITALPNASSSFLFAGNLPAGTYRVGLLWTELDIGDIAYYAKAFVPPVMGTFEIKPGKVTNLGTIIYHTLNVKNWSDTLMPDYVMTRKGNPNLMSSIVGIAPSISKKISIQSQELTWNEDKFNQLRENAVKLIEKDPLITNLFQTNKNEFVMTGKFGTLKSKYGDKVISYNLDTGKSILAFSALSDDQWLIGGEYGLLLTAARPFTEWQSINVNSLLEHVIDIETNENGKTFVMSSDGNTYNLYLYENNRLNLIKEFKGKKKFFFAETKISPSTMIDKGYIRVYLEKKVYSYNLNSNLWEPVSERKYYSIATQGNGVVVAFPYPGFFSKPPEYSIDSGKTWIKTIDLKKSLRHGRNPGFFSRSKEILFTSMDSKFSFWSIKWKTAPHTLVLKSHDNAKTWKKVGELPKYCLKIEPLVSKDDAVFLRCDNGNIHVTHDFGQNWELVYNANTVDSKEFPKELKLEYSKLKKQ